MNKSPIFIVDNDLDDKEILKDAWNELEFNNELCFFDNAEAVINQLESEPLVPFLIICELNLPKMSGLELKHYLLNHKHTNFKSIPFVFFSDTPSKKQIEEAYYLCTNGLFKKPNTFDDLKQQLIKIASYWKESLVPMG